MQELSCFECAAEGPLHDHHVVPRSRGGTKTVALCEACHGLVHELSLNTSALTRQAKRRKRARGEHPGGMVQYGYRKTADGIRLEEDPQEQQVVELARRLRTAGLSYRKIAQALEEHGYRSRAGKEFAAPQIQRMIDLRPATCPVLAFL